MKKDSATASRVPAFVEPMKAKLVDSIPPGDWIYEIKFDGYRALALRGGSESRLLSLGLAKLVRRSLICIRKQCCSS
jgi:ATP-dependent DNA ligase